MKHYTFVAIAVALIAGTALAWEPIWPPDCVNSPCVAIPEIQQAGTPEAPTPQPTVKLPDWYQLRPECIEKEPPRLEGMQAWVTTVTNTIGQPPTPTTTSVLCIRLIVDGLLTANTTYQVAYHCPEANSVDERSIPDTYGLQNYCGVPVGSIVPFTVSTQYINRVYRADLEYTVYPPAP